MVVQERSPGLGGRFSRAHQVFADTGFADGDAQLNFALLPEFVDRYLILEHVEYLRIHAIPAALNYTYTPVDFANAFGADGTIDWLGRVQRWTFPNDGSVTQSEENGEMIFRDRQGNIIAPY